MTNRVIDFDDLSEIIGAVLQLVFVLVHKRGTTMVFSVGIIGIIEDKLYCLSVGLYWSKEKIGLTRDTGTISGT